MPRFPTYLLPYLSPDERRGLLLALRATPGPWRVVLSNNATPHIVHEGGADWTDIDDRTSLVCAMPAEIMQRFNSAANAAYIAHHDPAEMILLYWSLASNRDTVDTYEGAAVYPDHDDTYAQIRALLEE